MDREITAFFKKFPKPVSLYLNAIRVTLPASWVRRGVKSAEHCKIFKTTSVKNLSAFSNNFLKPKVNDTFLMT